MTLVLNDNILFTRASDSKKTQGIIETSDVNFDGIRYGGFGSLSQFLSSSKESIEEKLYNVNITQDGSVTWVIFDYQFLLAGKVTNHGVETWQMFKSEGIGGKFLASSGHRIMIHEGTPQRVSKRLLTV